MLAGVLFLAREQWAWFHSPARPELRVGTETEAFLVLAYQRLGQEEEEGVVPAAMFREQMSALDDAGYTTVSVEEVARFYREGAPLPEKPVLVLFEQAHADTLDVAEEVLGSLDMRAFVLVDVEEVADVNLWLTSKRRLRNLVQTGRWSAGVSACMEREDGATIPGAERLTRLQVKLEEWTGRDVLAGGCPAVWSQDEERLSEWSTAAGEAGLDVGFVRAAASANYRDDPSHGLAVVPAEVGWNGEELASRLDAYRPLRKSFESDFPEEVLSPRWFRNRVQVRSGEESLFLAPASEAAGGTLVLGGTERWRDGEVHVKLSGRPEGQFWTYLRWAPEGSFVRLGVADGQVLLQTSSAGDPVRQQASAPLPSDASSLRLRLVGGRALAFLDDRPLHERPVILPDDLREGSVTLAVWSENGGGAEAALRSVRAEPLVRRSGIVDARPSEPQWAMLREEVPSLAVLSPRAFAWRGAGAQQLATPDQALAIFARYHRLAYYPGVVLDPAVTVAEYPALAEQLLTWAEETGADGMNLLVRLEGEDRIRRWGQLAEGLRRRLGESDLGLVVTLIGETERGDDPSLTAWSPYVLEPADGGSGLRIASNRRFLSLSAS